MTTVTKYRIYCTTDNKWEETWKETAPIVCPINHLHSVNENSVQELEKISPNTITIDEEYPTHTTGKNFRTESYTMICPAGVSTHQYTWPRPISVCETRFVAKIEHEGDFIDNKVGGHIPVGILTSNIETGANILSVSQTVIDNTSIGFLIEIKNGENSEELGELMMKNTINNKLTTELTTTRSYPIGSYVYFKAQIIKNYKIVNIGEHGIGIFRKSSSYLPENAPSTIYYTNNSAETKEITFYVEYLY